MEPWKSRFENLMGLGEACFELKDYDGARQLFSDAFREIPEPKTDLQESTRVVGALADTFYHLADYEKAEAALDDVLRCPGGAANPFLRLRRGQVFHQLGRTDEARVELTTAFLNGGHEVFEGDEEALTLIADVVAQLERESS